MKFIGLTLDSETIEIIDRVKEKLKGNRSSAVRFIVSEYAEKEGIKK